MAGMIFDVVNSEYFMEHIIKLLGWAKLTNFLICQTDQEQNTNCTNLNYHTLCEFIITNIKVITIVKLTMVGSNELVHYVIA